MWGVLIQVGVSLFSWAAPRLLAMFGVVAISTAVFQPAFAFLKSQMTSQLSGLGAEGYALMQYLGVQDAISIFFAAITLKLAIRAAKAATAKKASTD